ncbi:MAG: cyclic nucleotide-binding domain-containing protein [Planctomycetales bacterium]|nr:cyclic nucleotide-binding domain-containing protein [Planctomycetales bacterium]
MAPEPVRSTNNAVIQRRPQRWSEPFGVRMTASDVERLLAIAPFRSMDRGRFPKLVPLRGLLLNDTRVSRYEEGEIIIREGDYGHSAFLILSGEVDVSLRGLPPRVLGRTSGRQQSWWDAFLSSVGAPRVREARDATPTERETVTVRDEERGARVFLQDVPGLLGDDGRLTLGAGEFFGELAALSRTPRTATVIAKGPCELLEIRWQGLRDLLRHDPALRSHIHELYRSNALRVHLRETAWLKDLSDEAVRQIADATTFESYGEFDWHHDFNKERSLDVRDRIATEPVIAREGDYPDGLILIRSGFARLSVQYDDGHRTLEYLGKGRVFGLEELVHNHRSVDQIPWQRSLRALGYVDVLRVPTPVVERWILPSLERSTERLPSLDQLRLSIESRGSRGEATVRGPRPSPWSGDGEGVSDRTEFLVEHRLLNATRAMVIDLDRCTRCDDCVRACASTHGNNPRFNRVGPIHDRLMFVQACMHCQDPVCMIGCPTGAIGRDADSGVITINDPSCIGCGTCANSCPYHNITMVETFDRQGRPLVDDATSQPIVKATKCDFCHGRPSAPACQNACPHDALVRIDLTEPTELDRWLSKRRTA